MTGAAAMTDAWLFPELADGFAPRAKAKPKRGRLTPSETDLILYAKHRGRVHELTAHGALRKDGMAYGAAVRLVDRCVEHGWLSVSRNRRELTVTDEGLRMIGCRP